MTVRHVTSADNVGDDGFLIDASLARHASLRFGRLAEVGGAIDALTHLNRDYPAHDLGECLVAERLEPGAPMARGRDGQIRRALPRPEARQSLGAVDVGARRAEWLAVLRERREVGADARP